MNIDKFINDAERIFTRVAHEKWYSENKRIRRIVMEFNFFKFRRIRRHLSEINERSDVLEFKIHSNTNKEIVCISRK